MSYSSSLITDSLTRQRMPTLPALQSPSALAGLSSPSGGSIAHDHGWGGLGLVIASVCDTDEQTTALCFTKCPLWAASSREHPFFSHAARGDPTLLHTHSTIKHRQIVHVNTHTNMPSCAQSHKQKSRHFFVQTALCVYSVFQPDWDWDLQSVSLLRDHSCVFCRKKGLNSLISAGRKRWLLSDETMAALLWAAAAVQ